MPELTQEFVRARLDYNPETGVLTWKARDRGEFSTERAWKVWTVRRSGETAGSRQGMNSAYWYVLGTTAHRVAWLWANGTLPKQVTHLNGDTTDNRLCNLAPYSPQPTYANGDRKRMSPDYARELFDYDSATGKLFWRVRPREHFRTTRGQRLANTKFAGKEAGTENDFGHLAVEVEGNNWLVHRIVWMLHYGKLPGTVDHIDRNPKNNRIENLRECSQSENSVNSRRRASGAFSGVLESRPGVWRARLGVRRKRIHLGYFRTREDAELAYQKGLRDTFGEFVPHA